ncbi:hypothetical protein [Photobacterium leiognathi]|uniref:hypothetical protein n=1 Tax=Photobacterium leiognathi TaxID=553611 RepID=UPI002734C185|nr:hypothetical protein [Photobacterium leiognathi]
MLVGLGTFLAEMLGAEAISKYKQRKRNKILERLSRLEIDRNDAELKKDELIACFLLAEEAIVKSNSLEKVDKIVNIYTGSVANGSLYIGIDAYQEIMSIISDLSDREINLLIATYKFFESEYDPAWEHKDAAKNQQLYISEQLSIDHDLAKALLIRLGRTGLVISEKDNSNCYSLAVIEMGLDLMHISQLGKDLKDWIYLTQRQAL